MINQTMPKWAKAVCVILAILIGVIAAVLLGVRAYFRLSVSDYYRASEKGFRIPGLSDGFIPQGLAYEESRQLFLVTGYQKDGSASPVYLVENAEGSLEKTVYLAKEDGSAFCGHAGGLSVHGRYVYVAGGADYCLYVYSYDAILQAENGASVSSLGRFSTGSAEDGIRVSFTATEDGRLWVGEFYREENYKTPDSHKLTTKAGDHQQALAVAYEFSEEEGSVFGLNPVPTAAYSLPDLVQGMCFREGKVYLSTSYGLAFSHIWEYDAKKAVYQTDIGLTDTTLPLYALDSDALTKRVTIAPMSEEIVFADGKMYTMCESASNKYIFGKFTSAQWCYATDIDRMAGK
ncbi:MAG: hypothetical protein E7668_07040 [Ruminococcaceae bacterium]|nr:hypothetical protein [Oscillospiraceae bacterium]